MLDLKEAAAALNGQLLGENARFGGVTTDSRQMNAGDLLVAIRGERFDGHTFVAGALDSGAAGALADARGAAQIEARPLIVVADTRLALGRLAAHWRARWQGTLVGVTGSNGKTTVKEMIAAILRAHAGEDAVLATTGNRNNDIGMPLMLLRLRPRHRYAVIEMGMNHLGEIAYLTGLARPGVALINNAGTAHIGELGSRQAIAQAKGEIFEGLDKDGVAIVNSDDDFAPYWRGLLGARRVVDFALDAKAIVTAKVSALSPAVRMQASMGERNFPVEVPAPGRHNAMNALAAVAAAHALQIPAEAVCSGLAGVQGVKGRLQSKRGALGAAIIDDTYNANPDSVKAAIDVLVQCKGERVLVLGDLGELGALSLPLHREVGKAAKSAGLDRMYTLGEASAHASEAYGQGARHFLELGDLVAAVRAGLTSTTTVLVKGSRFMRMERVVEALGEDTVPGAGGHG
ncbi:MAG: UDP-N-acetylmuramoyl-tripeptide--D-alanyl-D-alanine ligase [Betaproteobacteria bacterium]|nr:UDP-N-acetylmuramoyl-tripeptide--D-alanyl-D-alanine ligase [Betaproteobacteria bacterium]